VTTKPSGSKYISRFTWQLDRIRHDGTHAESAASVMHASFIIRNTSSGTSQEQLDTTVCQPEMNDKNSLQKTTGQDAESHTSNRALTRTHILHIFSLTR
jgi:hypothetical protein